MAKSEDTARLMQVMGLGDKGTYKDVGALSQSVGGDGGLPLIAAVDDLLKAAPGPDAEERGEVEAVATPQATPPHAAPPHAAVPVASVPGAVPGTAASSSPPWSSPTPAEARPAPTGLGRIFQRHREGTPGAPGEGGTPLRSLFDRLR